MKVVKKKKVNRNWEFNSLCWSNANDRFFKVFKEVLNLSDYGKGDDVFIKPFMNSFKS